MAEHMQKSLIMVLIFLGVSAGCHCCFPPWVETQALLAAAKRMSSRSLEHTERVAAGGGGCDEISSGDLPLILLDDSEEGAGSADAPPAVLTKQHVK